MDFPGTVHVDERKSWCLIDTPWRGTGPSVERRFQAGDTVLGIVLAKVLANPLRRDSA